MKGIIIGGGIGGLTTAIALQKEGIEAVVYEAAPKIREVGAGIWVAPNAMNIAGRLGFAEEVLRVGILLETITAANQNGNILHTFNVNKSIRKFGYGTVTIHRAKLQEILISKLQPATLMTGKRCKSISETDEGVKVVFEDGTSASGDFLIGADGIHSMVRNKLFGEIPLRYSGQTCWRGIADFLLPKEYRSSCIEMWGIKPGQRFAFARVNDEQVYFYATLCSPAGEKDEKGTVREKLLNIFSSFPSIAIQILNAAQEQKIIRNDLFDFKPIKEWHKGKISLLGDAAHATTPNLGQGGCQAMEDAYVIAKCLSENREIEKAFEYYQQIRIKKAIKVVNSSYQIGQLTNWGGKLAYRFKSIATKFTPGFLMERQYDEIYRTNY